MSWLSVVVSVSRIKLQNVKFEEVTLSSLRILQKFAFTIDKI
jgi:hypothetical protein